MSDQKIIFSMEGVGKVYPNGDSVFKDIYLSFFYGAKIGVVGPNGSGKSTLLKIIAGLDKEYHGEVHRNSGISFDYLEQEPELDESKKVIDIVEEGVGETVALLKEYEEISAKFAEPDADFAALTERQSKLQEQIEQRDAWDLDSKLEMAMGALRCPPKETPIEVLSGGERRRVALCRILLKEPDVLLLDEPTNHLDAESVGWLEQHLEKYEGTVIAVTHDRYFLNNVAGWILEMERGKGVPFEGNYSSWLQQKEERLQKRNKNGSQRRETLQSELSWIRSTPKERQAKSQARIDAYEDMLANQRSGSLDELEIYIPPGPRLGDVVIEAEGLAKGYEDKLLYQNLSFHLPPGAIVGIVGPNGAGKTTLFRMITGEEEPDEGEIRIGETVKLGYIDQRRPLDPEATVYEAISEGQEKIDLGQRTVNARAYVSWFNFSGSDQQKKTKVLSGGERNRLYLAKVLKEQSNVLLLDEPSNDLDVATLRALEEALLHFAGCAAVISHDRWFLDRIATHILAFEGDSEVVWFQGNYSEYEEDRRQRLGKDALRPERIKYKRLKRD